MTNFINYKKINQKKKATTLYSLATGEFLAADELVKKKLYKESMIHLYFSSYYLAQSLILDTLKSDSHKAVDSEFNRRFGRGSKQVPKVYVKLHSKLHIERNYYSYKATHTPLSSDIISLLKSLKAFHNFVNKILLKVSTSDIIRTLYETNKNDIKDISYDIYCPKTYRHHNRITFWQPPFYLNIFNERRLTNTLKEGIKKLRIKNHNNYVLGINSKVSQYEENHFLMLDFDSLDTDVEQILKEIGGVMLKSGRGFHFISTHLYLGRNNWISELKRVMKIKEFKGRIDKEHILFSIKRGYSTLRITECAIKPNIPIFYKELK